MAWRQCNAQTSLSYDAVSWESGMSRTAKIDRARRNTLKAASLVGAFLATSALHSQASAAPGNNGNGNGGCGVGQQTNGCGGNGNNGNSGGNCFARGTLIRTREGYRQIETLAVGDEVAVRFGGFAPIKAMVSHTLNSVAGKWVGESNVPVLVRRGALGENSPNADLCLTALHPVFVDGFLMPVGELANGTSVIFETADGQDTLDFFNIDLDRHDILDVQGAFCESLYRAGTERCAPLVLGFDGRLSRLQSHMRSVASLVIDRRQPIDIIRDTLEERAVGFARAA
jgi:Hint domain